MEPERPIEKLLRAFAKKRREQAGAPVELHSAMRQQLQKEIERRRAAPDSGGWFSRFLIGFRPRLAFAICFTGLLIMGLMFLENLNRPKPSTLASINMSRERDARAEKMIPVPQSPPVTTVAPALVDEKRQAIQDKQPVVSGRLAPVQVQPELAGANRQLAVPPTETPKQANVLKNEITPTEASTGVVVASTPPANKETYAFKADDEVVNSSGGVAVLSKDATDQPLPATPSAPVTLWAATNTTTFAVNEEAAKKLNTQKQSIVPASASAAYFDRIKAEAPVAIQSVSQLFNRADTSATRRRAAESLNGSSPVLVSFRVEQTGNALRVVDADGSVYTGAVQVAQQASTTRAIPSKSAPTLAQAARTPAPTQTAQNYSFRVAGTNRNLKQNVIFSGNFVPLTNNSPITGVGKIGGFGGAAPVSVVPSDLRLSNSQISGTAVIGNQKGIEVIATPAP
jgi:hypothetical protein